MDFSTEVKALLDDRNFDRAEALCRERLKTLPGDVAATYFLGVTTFYRADFPAARVLLRRASILAPDDADILHALGLCLFLGGDPEDAVAPLRRAVALLPGFAQAWSNLGRALAETGRADEALDAYGRAIAADPAYPESHVGRGDLSWRSNRPDDAVADYEAALRLDPRHAAARYKAATVLPLLPKSEADIDRWRVRLHAAMAALIRAPVPLADPAREVGRTLFHLAYHGRDDRDLQIEAARMYLAACPALGEIAPHCRDWRGVSGRRIRIGFVSEFLGRHTIGDLNRLLIAGLPRNRFEVTIHVVGEPRPDDLEAMRACAERVDVLPGDLTRMRARIAESRPDILYYPEIGMSPRTYFLAFARLAPVQCTTWGHPETSGLPNMDYFIAMADAETAEAQAHYSETLVRLPSIVKVPCPPRPAGVLTRAELGLPQDARLYVCLQAPFKIHPAMDRTIAAILKADDRAAVCLLGGKQAFWGEDLRRRLSRTMGADLVAPPRLTILQPMPYERFQAVLGHADTLLDPPHFSGGKTSLESFWLDQPVVTLPGPFARSRVTAAYYRRMGIDDCVVTTEADYVALAVKIATDQAFKDRLRSKIAARKAVLFNDDEAVTAHIAFFEQALLTER